LINSRRTSGKLFLFSRGVATPPRSKTHSALDHTGLFGKWHLGRNWPNRPQDRGFDETFVLYGFGTTGISSRWNNDYQNTWFVRNGEEVQSEGFCTDAIFDEAMQWMAGQADRHEPFFAFISTNAPHFPFWAPEAWTKPYAGTDNPEFFAMLKNLDDNVGRLLNFLDERALAEDTIVVFLSDNGAVGGKSTYNAGMTGSKATPWEGGHRVPLFVRYLATLRRSIPSGKMIRIRRLRLTRAARETSPSRG